jgi:hypothetical protein
MRDLQDIIRVNEEEAARQAALKSGPTAEALAKSFGVKLWKGVAGWYYEVEEVDAGPFPSAEEAAEDFLVTDLPDWRSHYGIAA